MVEAQREIEQKYEAPTGCGTPQLPDLTCAPEVSVVVARGRVHLDAVYYDTADGRLAADRITLRRRTGGSDAGWHLKLPVSLAEGVRDEIRVPLEGAAQRPAGAGEPAEHDAGASAHGADADPPKALPAPPPELAALVRSRVRHAPLVPVVRLRTIRRPYDLVGAGGVRLAEVSVDSVHAERLGGPGAPEDGAVRTTDWTEAEVELAEGGSRELLDRVGEQVRAVGWRPSRAPSKLSRALQETSADGTSPGSGPAAPAAPPVVAGAPAAAPVLDRLRAQRDALVALDPAVRRGVPDAVHRMRVATRRARSVLRAYRGVLDRAATDPIAAELRWLAAELGADRDREVLTQRLTSGLDDLPAGLPAGPVRDRLRDWSRARHEQARRRLLAVLDGERYLALLDALDELLSDPPLRAAATRPARPVLGTAVRRERRRLRRRLAEALRRPPGADRDTALHEARKAAKRVRYAAEAAAPVLGKRAARTVSRAKRIQRLLGDHQDGVMARDLLLDLAAEARAAGEDTFVYGLLYGREEQRAAHDAQLLRGVRRC